MLYAIVAVLVILADQMIKLYVSAEGFRTMPLIPGFLNLTKVENTGGAFGLLGGEIPTYWFIIIAGVFTVLVIIALSTKFIKGFLARWSIVLVTAGGISNCIDRVINVRPTGHVVDMFQFDFWQTFPVFNLADIFITVFCIVFIFAILFGRDPKPAEDEEDEFAEDEEESLLEEDDEEEIRPARRGRKARRDEDEDLEDEDYRPAKTKASRKARQSKYDEEYEQYKAAQRAKEEAAQRAREAAARQPMPDAVVDNPSYNPADPFAEWERANAQRPAPTPFYDAQDEAATVPLSRPVSASRSDLDADPRYAQPAVPAAPAAPAAPADPTVVLAKPAQPEEPTEPAPKPAPRPARRPAPPPEKEDPSSFSLDDILAEFK